MSHFYGSMQGNHGETTRQGTKKSGISTHIRGWNFGVKVIMSPGSEGDVADIYLTCGSDGAGYSKYLGSFTSEIADEFTKYAQAWFEERRQDEDQKKGVPLDAK